MGRHRYLWLLPVLALVAVVIVGMRWLSETPEELDLANVGATGSLRDEAGQTPTEPGGVAGTSGNFGGPPRGSQGQAREGAPAPSEAGTAGADTTAPAASPIADIGAMLGGADAGDLVGRQVGVHLPVQATGGQVAFWLGGSRRERLLVVMSRDVRDAEERFNALPSPHALVRLEPGQTAQISGTIERLPRREARYSWNLTGPELEEVESRGVYLRAERVTPANGLPGPAGSADVPAEPETGSGNATGTTPFPAPESRAR